MGLRRWRCRTGGGKIRSGCLVERKKIYVVIDDIGGDKCVWMDRTVVLWCGEEK